MDFYKLSDFQLYSILNSRHLDKKSKEQGDRELERRNLSNERMQELKDELAEKTKAASSVFNLSPNVLLLVGVLILLFLLRKFLYR